MAASARTLLFQLYLIVQWIVLSSTIILFNKYLLSTTGFHFPLTLVMMHMAFVAACAHLWRAAGWTDSPAISWRDVGTRFLPIAALFAASLGLGNAAYLYISVAFVQMLKASTPVAVLLASFAFRLERPSGELMLYIVVIAMGVALACYSQLQISVLGVTLQLLAVVAEALRLCLVNIALTAHNIKLPTVTFLSVIAPLCALVLVPPWLLTEASSLSADGFAPLQRVGAPILLANASVAFLLNLSTMALIKHTSALTLNVAGVFKDLLLIGWSVVVSGAVVRHLQYAGYAVALAGVICYSSYKRRQQATPAQVSSTASTEETVPLADVPMNAEDEETRQEERCSR